MFKEVKHTVWAFDVEWVPDPEAGRILYTLPGDMPDGDVMEEMWKRNGATDENPQPFLKTALCRVVSVAMVMRRDAGNNNIQLDLRSQPKDASDASDCAERSILEKFLTSIGKIGPQLVGFNSSGADLPILIQRGIAKGVTAREFCKRPEKPWQGRDYFSRGSQWHIDLMYETSPPGNAAPKLTELAQISGIPGKLDFRGSDTAGAWLAGDIDAIVQYNEHDALTTYLLWLRVAHFGGLFTTEEYKGEQDRLQSFLEERSAKDGGQHLKVYLDAWASLRT